VILPAPPALSDSGPERADKRRSSPRTLLSMNTSESATMGGVVRWNSGLPAASERHHAAVYPHHDRSAGP
jgi:hypothetical protein